MTTHILAGERGVRLGMERRHRRHRRDHHAHGVGVIAEALHHLGEVLVDKRVAHDALGEVVELVLRKAMLSC